MTTEKWIAWLLIIPVIVIFTVLIGLDIFGEEPILTSKGRGTMLILGPVSLGLCVWALWEIYFPWRVE